MTEISEGFAALFAHGPAIAVQRAVAELRSGRPVLLEGAGVRLLAAAADTAAPGVFAAFRRAPGAALALTAARAEAMGLGAGRGVLLPLAGLDQAGVEALAAAQGAVWDGAVWDGAVWDGGVMAGDAGAEAALELCKRAQLLPAALVAVGAEPEGIVRLDLADLAADAACAAIEIVSSAAVPLGSVPARFVVFRSPGTPRDQVAVILGDPDPEEPVLVRLHSACLTGDLFGSLRCDCGDQLRQAMDRLLGGGVLLYLDQEGRGTGLRNKMRAYALQDAGLDTIDADRTLGYGPDERRYGLAAAMLRQLGFLRVRLLTNNPGKLSALTQEGIEVLGHAPLLAPMTAENRRYLVAKAERGGHMLDALFADLPPDGGG